MKIDSMILREDFFKILSETVETYYKKVHDKKVVFSYAKNKDLEQLIVNAKLSFVSRETVPKGLRKFLLAEYNIRGSKIKYLAGKAIVYMVCMFPVIGKCKTAYITKEALGNNVFISPQNRSIRFFDYDQMLVDCIVKQGFSDRYFRNQIKFRKNYKYDFMVPLIESGEDWFREEILCGHALARTTNPQLYEKGIKDTLRSIRTLAEDTYQEVPTQKFSEEILQRLKRLISEAEKRKKVNGLSELETIVIHASESINRLENIPTVMSHGDLQSGNIWIDDSGNTLIYDWETVDRRSIWYDSTVLRYSLRRMYGWKDFIEDPNPQTVLSCEKQHQRSFDEMYAIKNIVLLEDILFYLEDMIELPDDWGSDIFNNYLERIIKTLNMDMRVPKNKDDKQYERITREFLLPANTRQFDTGRKKTCV